MSREVRRVPLNWEHPTREGRGYYGGKREPIPMHEGKDFARSVEFYLEYALKWLRDPKKRAEEPDFMEYYGPAPDPTEYTPIFPEEECVGWQMYETVTEGTPISPVCKSPEDLARWLADNGASACGSETATYDQWLRMIGAGSAISMVYDPARGLRSGVAAISDFEKSEEVD